MPPYMQNQFFYAPSPDHCALDCGGSLLPETEIYAAAWGLGGQISPPVWLPALPEGFSLLNSSLYLLSLSGTSREKKQIVGEGWRLGE